MYIGVRISMDSFTKIRNCIFKIKMPKTDEHIYYLLYKFLNDFH